MKWITIMLLSFSALASSPLVAEEGWSEDRWMSYASKMAKSDEVEEAIIAYRKVLEANPENVQALRGLAKCFADKGDFKSSSRYSKLASKLEVEEEVEESEGSEISPNYLSQISVEIGYQDSGFSDEDVAAYEQLAVKSMKALGWATTKGNHKIERQRLQFGAKYSIEFDNGAIALGGFRKIAESSYRIDASDSTNTPSYQWINYNEAGNASVHGVFVGVGFGSKFGESGFSRIRLVGELEWGVLSGSLYSKLNGFNGSNFDFTEEMNFDGSNLGTNLRAGIDFRLGQNAVFGIDGGYRYLKFNSVKITKYSSNLISTRKVGDVLKDSSGKDASVDVGNLFGVVTFGVRF